MGIILAWLTGVDNTVAGVIGREHPIVGGGIERSADGEGHLQFSILNWNGITNNVGDLFGSKSKKNIRKGFIYIKIYK